MTRITSRIRNRIIVILLGSIIIIVVVSIPNKQTIPTLTPTIFASRYASGHDSVAPDYRGEFNPNKDAAQQYFTIFDLAAQPLPVELKTSITTTLGSALSKELPPVQGTTYVHVVKNSIQCLDVYDCAFSFYLDSPESYFSYHLYNQPDGTQNYTLLRQSLPGVVQ